MPQSLDYGAFIKSRRKELHISQQALATALECTPQAVSKYENDKAGIYLGLVGPLAKLLQVDVSSFLACRHEKNNDLADRYGFDRKAFQETLLFLRERAALTQKAFSEKVGIPVFRITKWETGKGLPSLEEFLQIADFFQVPKDELDFAKLPMYAPKAKESQPVVEKKEKEPVKEELKEEKTKKNNRGLFILFASLLVLLLVLLIVLLALFLPRHSTPSSSSQTSSSFPSSLVSGSSSSTTGRPSSNSSTGTPPGILSVDIEKEK